VDAARADRGRDGRDADRDRAVDPGAGPDRRGAAGHRVAGRCGGFQDDPAAAGRRDRHDRDRRAHHDRHAHHDRRAHRGVDGRGADRAGPASVARRARARSAPGPVLARRV